MTSELELQSKGSSRRNKAVANGTAYDVCDRFGNSIWVLESQRAAESMLTKRMIKQGWYVEKHNV